MQLVFVMCDGREWSMMNREWKFSNQCNQYKECVFIEPNECESSIELNQTQYSKGFIEIKFINKNSL